MPARRSLALWLSEHWSKACKPALDESPHLLLDCLTEPILVPKKPDQQGEILLQKAFNKLHMFPGVVPFRQHRKDIAQVLGDPHLNTGEQAGEGTHREQLSDSQRVAGCVEGASRPG